MEEWISGVSHPGFEPVSHLLEHAGEGGISREVVRFVGVVKQIVELFRGYGTLCVTVGEDDVLARAVVYVGQYGGRVFVVEAADVLPAVRPDAPLGLVSDMLGLLGEDGVADLVCLAVHKR